MPHEAKTVFVTFGLPLLGQYKKTNKSLRMALVNTRGRKRHFLATCWCYDGV